MIFLSASLTGVVHADEAPPHAPLKFDVAAAQRDAERSKTPSDVTQLGPVIVRGRRSLADALPCIGCDGRVVVPMHRLQDFTDIVQSLLIVHPPSQPESPEDRARSFAHEGTCIDGGFGCLAPK